MLEIGTEQTNHAVGERLTWGDWRPTFVAAGTAAAAAAALLIGVNSVSSFEQVAAVAAMIGGVQWIASASIATCGTIAALSLTTLGLLDRLETRRVTPRFLHHLRLELIGAFATIGASIAALLVTALPTAAGGESVPDPTRVAVVYWALLAFVVAIVGGLAVVLASLYSTIADVFRNLPREWVDDILAEPPADPDDRFPGSERSAEEMDGATTEWTVVPSRRA